MYVVRNFLNRMFIQMSSKETAMKEIILKPLAVHNLTPSSPDFVVAGSGLTCNGQRLIMSVRRDDYANADDPTQTSWYKGSPVKEVHEPYDCIVDVFDFERSERPVHSEVLSRVTARRPMLGRFSDGSILVVSRPIYSIENEVRDCPNAFVFKGGRKIDEFRTGRYPEGLGIDCAGNIWVCPSEVMLDAGHTVNARGESCGQIMSYFAPMCMTRNGFLNRKMMPWTRMKRVFSEWCAVNIDDRRVAVVTECGDIGLGYVDGKGALSLIATNGQEWHSDGFALDSKYLMVLHENNTVSISKLGDDPGIEKMVLRINQDETTRGLLHHIASRGEEIHVQCENRLEIYTISDVIRQLKGQDEFFLNAGA